MDATERKIQEAKERRNLAKGRFEKRAQQVRELEEELARAQRELLDFEAGAADAEAEVYQTRCDAYLALPKQTAAERKAMMWNSARAGEYREDAYQLRGGKRV